MNFLVSQLARIIGAIMMTVMSIAYLVMSILDPDRAVALGIGYICAIMTLIFIRWAAKNGH